MNKLHPMPDANLQDMNTKRAILIINLGTPSDPSEESIRSYLKQFLSDPRVVDLPRWLWLPILNLIILRVRPRKLVEKYQLIWGSHDGPIRNFTQALANRVQELLGNVPVHNAMTYGQPSVAEAIEKIGDVEEIVVLPLFAQYASATTGAAEDALKAASINKHVKIRFIDDYHDDPGYIKALVATINNHKMYKDLSPFILFSFHGIPASQSLKDTRYQEQCLNTSKLIAKQLKISDNQWRTAFQSRFGPLPWLKPYTDKTMESLPSEGIKNVLVICPGFAVDCLETIEEIAVQNRDIFLAAGGESFGYVKALNASWSHAKVIANLVT